MAIILTRRIVQDDRRAAKRLVIHSVTFLAVHVSNIVNIALVKLKRGQNHITEYPHLIDVNLLSKFISEESNRVL